MTSTQNVFNVLMLHLSMNFKLMKCAQVEYALSETLGTRSGSEYRSKILMYLHIHNKIS